MRSFARATGSMAGTEQRKMFGYPAVFVNGNMFAGLFRDSLVLRLGEADREAFLALPGASPFIPMGRRMKEWVVAPAAMTRSPARLSAWLDKALAHGRSLAPKVARRRGGGDPPGPRAARQRRTAR